MSAPCEMAGPLATNDIAATALKLAEVVELLGRCAVKHAGAVNAYVAARAEAQLWNEGR